jgi:HTH-type transcriptional regulator/antitoxin HigA
MIEKLVPARVSSPGRILGKELAGRGWTADDLAEAIGCSPQMINEIIAGKTLITAEIAAQLAAALGIPAEFWLTSVANSDEFLKFREVSNNRGQGRI